jgi:hypothetical protein
MSIALDYCAVFLNILKMFSEGNPHVVIDINKKGEAAFIRF